MTYAEFQELAITVELIDLEVRYNPEELDDWAKETIALYERELQIIQMEEKGA